MDRAPNSPVSNTQPQRFDIAALKPWLESLQTIATIGAILAGGIWTYTLFVKERQNRAHAIIEERVSHLALTPDVNLVQVVVTVKNAGHELINVTDVRLNLQRVLPIKGCAENGTCVVDELNRASGEPARPDDRFSWPVIASRTTKGMSPHPIEPDESEIMDFEFVVPANVTTLRAYAFVKNDEESGQQEPATGWHTAQFYSFSPSKDADK